MNTIVHPDYWQQAVEALASVDEVLSKLIASHRGLHIRSRGDAFFSLARAIVGQQVSVKAAESIWQRVIDKVVDMAPAVIIEFDPRELQSCGLSSRKVLYLQDLSRYFIENPFDFDQWSTYNDAEIVQRLTTIKGVGQWTAEMFLIFFMARPNVLPVDDIGLQRAMSRFYNQGQPISKLKMREVARKWQPWHSVATWYLWRSLDPSPIQY